MTTAAAITAILETEPILKASTIGERFGVDRCDINRILNDNPAQLAKSDDHSHLQLTSNTPLRPPAAVNGDLPHTLTNH